MKHLVLLVVGVVLINMSFALALDSYYRMRFVNLNIYPTSNVEFTLGSIHSTIKFYKNGVQVGYQYHAGALTKLGMNMTLAKLTGNSTFYNTTQYNLNLTYVSIGNQGTLDSDSLELPGEWNRTSGNQHTLTYNSFNITAVFYPDSGPHTADCIGLNFEDLSLIHI